MENNKNLVTAHENSMARHKTVESRKIKCIAQLFSKILEAKMQNMERLTLFKYRKKERIIISFEAIIQLHEQIF
jgi:hypothetical protein